MTINKGINLPASWCSPGKAFEPTFVNVSKLEDFKDVKFERYDIESDEGTEYVENFNIKSVPTTLLMNDKDEVVLKLSGNLPEADFVNAIKNN